MQGGELLHVHAAAERLGVSIYTVRSWLRQRKLPHAKLGRRVLVPAAAIEDFIAANTVPVRNDRPRLRGGAV